jgi:predicted dehydrogenase
MPNMKIGVIGLGAIGNVHLDAYRNCGQADVIAISDVDAKKLTAAGNRLGLSSTQQFGDYRDLLASSEVQAVSVCVPNAFHREMAVAALRAGKHVLLEKPMAVSAKEAKLIADAAAKAKGVLQMGMINRHAPESQIVREWAERAALGEVYHMRAVWVRRRGVPGLGGWFTTKAASGGGPMIDLGVHLFDLAMYLSGHWRPTSVSAMTYAKFGKRMRDYKYVRMWAGPPKFDGVFDVEDYATGMVRFGNKATMSFEISWAANAQEERYVEVMGDKAGARVMTGQPLQIWTEHEGRVTDITPKYDDKVSTWETQARKFLAACRGEMKPVATAEQGLTVMKLIDAIYASGKAAKEVKIG